MTELCRTIRKIAEFKTTVLVGGESGTGKELVARALHRLSPRRTPGRSSPSTAAPSPGRCSSPSCSATARAPSPTPTATSKGLFEEADGGTLFLDEIGELPLALQVKLLRVLQEEEIRRLGDIQDVKVDVRVVAATARDLAARWRAGRSARTSTTG